MTSPRRIRRSVVTLACIGAVALGGCGGEPLPVDDGSQASLDGAALPEGTEVLDLDSPISATTEEVVAALATESIQADARRRTEATGLFLDPVTVAGLVGSVSPAAKGRGKPFVVLVFDEPASALVFVAEGRAVLAPGRGAGRVESIFSGNVVGYYAPQRSSTDRDAFVRALSSLVDP